LISRLSKGFRRDIYNLGTNPNSNKPVNAELHRLQPQISPLQKLVLAPERDSGKQENDDVGVQALAGVFGSFRGGPAMTGESLNSNKAGAAG
jgi:hypothetical protein